ncbi:hypothetical protein BJ138DRAFT_1100132 [Hygrophoropsis aurantiaca]|uniref:Uncharacterized protein n=1 Tax=Hygrophoropsis aurantiaca TaxID=72124 RepID=A0ACB8AHH2_9AGAM|nr:hypothetical protein BJ138DRAFT_1100132 [Hygrophoropsis aurantiaca]
MFSRIALVSTVAAFVGAVSAQLTITNPSANSWWVAQSLNTLAWTCSSSPYQNFTVLIAGPNTPAIAIIAVQYSYDCSETITQQQSTQPAGTGYTIQLASTLNQTDIYATSEPFEIKALGASYPATSSSPSGTGSAAQPSGKSGGALSTYIPAGMSMAAAIALGLVVA